MNSELFLHVCRQDVSVCARVCVCSSVCAQVHVNMCMAM